MKRWLKVLLIILGILIIIVAAFMIFMTQSNKNLKALLEIPIKDVDITAIPDGTYSGHYKAQPIDVEVAVSVKGGKITDIDLIKHFNGKGGAAEVIPGIVVEKQTLKVDTITGATYSSKVILLAIEDALKSAA